MWEQVRITKLYWLFTEPLLLSLFRISSLISFWLQARSANSGLRLGFRNWFHV